MSNRSAKPRGSHSHRCSSFGEYALPRFSTGAGSVFDLRGNVRVYRMAFSSKDDAAAFARDRCALASDFEESTARMLAEEKVDVRKRALAYSWAVNPFAWGVPAQAHAGLSDESDESNESQSELPGVGSNRH